MRQDLVSNPIRYTNWDFRLGFSNYGRISTSPDANKTNSVGILNCLYLYIYFIYFFFLKALLCNILPPHVAAHFLGAQRQIRQQQHQGEQLYSQSYTDVGVLFASIPNFSGRTTGKITKLQLNLISVSIAFLSVMN